MGTSWGKLQFPNAFFTFSFTVKPLFVRMRQRQAEKLVAGKEYRLVCETAGSKPPALLKWIKGGKEIKQVSTQVSFRSFITGLLQSKEIEYTLEIYFRKWRVFFLQNSMHRLFLYNTLFSIRFIRYSSRSIFSRRTNHPSLQVSNLQGNRSFLCVFSVQHENSTTLNFHSLSSFQNLKRPILCIM